MRSLLSSRLRGAPASAAASPALRPASRSDIATAVARRCVHTASTGASSPSAPAAGLVPAAACLAAHGVPIAALRAAFDSAAHTDPASAAVREGDVVTVRARVERVRGRGKLAFLHLRQPPLESLQAVCEGKELAKQAKDITPESIADVTGVVHRAATAVQSTTCHGCELRVTALHVISRAAPPLPFPYHDPNTKLDTRLNHRVIDLRTERMVAVARLVSALGQCFRDELLARGFIEVHTPKLLGAASEGGSNVFQVDYFERKAYLAQSPQLYKQMMLMGDAMRVFEVGPVFRAENSLTHRHLTEFVGLDGEMVIQQSHTEVLDVLEPVMCAMLARLTTAYRPLLDVLRQQLAPPSSRESPPVSEDQGTPAADALSGATHDSALQDVCCHVSPARMVELGIATDGQTTAQARPPSPAAPADVTAADPYHARVGGGGGGCRVLRLAFADAARLLMDHGGPHAAPADRAVPLDDFSLPQERRLGQLIKDRYGVDLYVVDAFPAAARPFYTMPVSEAAPEGPTRSFDMYLRGEEICSGAQRVHDVALLERRLAAKQVDAASVKDYVDAFRYGAWPHGGFGLGLERIALFFTGLGDIRQVSLFPRDPKRISP